MEFPDAIQAAAMLDEPFDAAALATLARDSGLSRLEQTTDEDASHAIAQLEAMGLLTRARSPLRRTDGGQFRLTEAARAAADAGVYG